MSTIAAHGRQAAEHRPANRRIRRGSAVAGAGALALALGLAPALVPEAAAQSRSGIFINNDVLNSLGPGPEATPFTPMAPVSPPPTLAPLSPDFSSSAPAGSAPGDLTFPTYGSGNYVVTRPGTLLFPPLQEPSSTLAPGFAGTVDNEAARKEALDNAFAGGPEPRSLLLIPLDDGMSSGGDSDSVLVFMDQLPPADPDAVQGSAPVLTLQRPPQPAPQPAPKKPEVPAEMLAGIDQAPVDSDPAALAPEFQHSEFQHSEFQAPEQPEVAELPPMAPVEQAPVAEVAPEPMTEVAAMPVTEPAPTPAPAPAPSPEPVGSAEVAAPVTRAETTTQAAEAPVSLLPAAGGDTAARDPEPAPERVAGLQTASLAIGDGLEDMTFLFDVDSAELSAETTAELHALANVMRSNEEWIQVLGFASGQDGSEDQARKLALSRALKVRSFLIDAGIASGRIQVRSLGDRAEGGPANRVDIKPIGS
jgi:outer membrane protein OmpA-like peptidoglycan-associated protein